MEIKQETIQERKTKLGDIFVCDWGYDQTNTDFYRVTGLTAKCIKLRKLKKEVTEDGFMCGKSVPLNEFANDIILTKKVYYHRGIPHVSMQYGSCELWDGKPQYTSWYA